MFISKRKYNSVMFDKDIEISQLKQNIKVLTKERDEARNLKAILEKVCPLSMAVEEHSQILSFDKGLYDDAVCIHTETFKLNDTVLDIDYRDNELFNRNKMCKLIIVQKDGNKIDKYTKEKNLTNKEKEYYKKNGFVLVDETLK